MLEHWNIEWTPFDWQKQRRKIGNIDVQLIDLFMQQIWIWQYAFYKGYPKMSTFSIIDADTKSIQQYCLIASKKSWNRIFSKRRLFFKTFTLSAEVIPYWVVIVATSTSVKVALRCIISIITERIICPKSSLTSKVWNSSICIWIKALTVLW